MGMLLKSYPSLEKESFAIFFIPFQIWSTAL